MTDEAGQNASTLDAELFRTQTGGRLHVRQCPHVQGVEVLIPAEVSSAQPVCDWCEKELAGEGRTYHDTVIDALRDMGAAGHAIPELERLLNEVEWDQTFVPFSRSYVAVSRAGRGVAWAGKTYVAYHDRPSVLLPDFVLTGGGAMAKRPEIWGDTCPDCNEARSLSGACAC